MHEPMPQFIPLLPPAGGLQRLRQSVRADAARPRRTRWPAWVVGTATACMLAALLAPYGLAHYRAVRLTRALQQALQPAAAAPAIAVVHGAAIELQSTRADVRVYLVQGAPPG